MSSLIISILLALNIFQVPGFSGEGLTEKELFEKLSGPDRARILDSYPELKNLPATMFDQTDANRSGKPATMFDQTDANRSGKPATMFDQTDANRSGKPATMFDQTDANKNATPGTLFDQTDGN